MQQTIERIDGTDYVVGTADHAAALAHREQRADAAFLEQHHHLFERNMRLIRSMPNLKDEVRMDSNRTAFLARQLVYTRAQVERMIYEKLRAPEFVPVETGHPRGAKNYATQLIDEVGEAKVTEDLAGDDPRADVDVTEDLRKYANVRGSYAYTMQDMEYAAFAGVPLPKWKAEACANMIARGVDKIGRSGNAKLGLTGFFNNASVVVHTLTNGEWLTATVDEILADLNEIEQTIIAASRDTQEEYDSYSLVLPTAYEGRLSTTARATGSDMSIKNWFLANARLITSIERYVALDSAVSPDIAAADAPQGICYPRDPSVLFWPMPITYEELTPELKGWEYLVRARARVGGVEFRRPMHCLYVQNLD